MYTLCIIVMAALSLLSLAEQQTCSTAYAPGSFTYTVGSTATTGYLIQAGGSNSWGPVSTSGSSITVGEGPRFYLANSCASAFSSSVFEAVKLLGGSVTFTVDLTNIGCGLDAAFYLVNMPGPGSSSNGDWYCDANCVGGQCCAEMDLMEANRHALQVTAHKCTSATGGCDAGGCARNTQSLGTTAYGPSSSYTINTLNAFTVKISFGTTSGSLTSITTVISQGSKSITLSHTDANGCGTGYLEAFGTTLGTGMVPVWSYWAGSMSWLDSPACSSDSAEVTGSFVFSNFIVSGTESTALGSGAPTPVAPYPPGALQCGQEGTSNNQWWVEFFPPTGVNGATTSATVSCTSGSCLACTWFASGSKYQCSCPNAGCIGPVAYVGGKECILNPSLAVLSDSTATTNLSSSQTMIIGFSVTVAVLVVVVIVLAVFLGKKNSNPIEVA